MRKNATRKNVFSAIRTHALFEALYKLLAVTAVVCVSAPFSYPLFFAPLGLSGAALLLPPGLVALGYLLQSLYAAGAKLKRPSGDSSGSYERNVRYFRPEKAVLTITVCSALSLATIPLTNSYLYSRVTAGLLEYYDPSSLYPYMALLLAAFYMISGIVLWFYPYNRIVSERTLFPCIAILLISFFVCGGNDWFVTLCSVVFLFCFVLLLNQSYIIKTVGISKTGNVTGNMRLYNIALIVLLGLCTAAALVVMLVIVIGLTVSFKTLLYFTLASVFRDESSSYRKPEAVAASVGDAVFDLSFMNIYDPNIAKAATLIFGILFILVMLFFIISRRYDVWRMIKTFFAALYSNILEFISNVFYFFRNNAPEVAADYKDEELKMDDGTVREYRPEAEQKKLRSYRDFLAQLNSRKTDFDRLCFAYNYLVACWKEMSLALAVSDTAREIKDKVASRFEIHDLERITDAFERVRYSSEPPSSAEVNEVLSGMCVLIAKYSEV